MRWSVLHAKVLDALAEMPENSFDASLFDPPYGLRFMGKRWDYDVPSVEVFAELRRVLKPGAPCIFFGGTRTFHRMACNAEDGGIELADCLAWMYGSGFPKSLDISKALDKASREVVGSKIGRPGYSIAVDKGRNVACVASGNSEKECQITAPATPLAQQWEGYGTALKPAWEPAILGFKPNEGTYANNVARWVVGGLAIDACRIATDWNERPESWKRSGHSAKPDAKKIAAPAGNGIECHPLGRWPANVILDEEAGALLDEQTGMLKSGNLNAGHKRGSGNTSYDGGGGVVRRDYGGDSGGASRFFYCAKVSSEERDLGCDDLPMRSAAEVTGREDGKIGVYVRGELVGVHDTAEAAEAQYRALGGETDPLVGLGDIRPAGLSNPRAGAGRGSGARNPHPTLKPIALTTWLARLILPPPRVDGSPRRILVPYCGAGSEMIGALLAGWDDVTGIEMDPEYIAVCRARVSLAATNPRAFEPSANRKAEPVDERQTSLFKTGT